MFAARLSGGTIIRIFGPVKSALFSGISATIGTAIVIGLATPYWSLVGFVFMGLGYALAVPLGFRRAGNDPHIPPAQAIASVATLGYGGMLISPPFIGFLAQATDLRIAFGSLFVLAVAMIFLAPKLRS
jgi:MFS family permease